MKFSIAVILSSALFIAFTSLLPKDRWTNLLDSNLSQWGMYLSYRHAESYKGEMPKDGKGEMIEPIGYNKNTDSVFSVRVENGIPVLRISGEIYGCLFTKEEFKNYDLKLKVKWGTKKWVPRTQKLRDAGICYHSIGECGKDYGGVGCSLRSFRSWKGIWATTGISPIPP